MVKRLVDAHFTVTNWIDIELCRIAIISGTALTMNRHHGYIIEAKTNGNALEVVLTHSGPPICRCKEKPQLTDEQLYDR
jgi:hypothetical protein